MSELGPIDLKRHEGGEPFCDDGLSLGFDLLSFWQWSSSDVVSNATRGVLAEYLVAQALGVAEDSLREEWGPLMTPPEKEKRPVGFQPIRPKPRKK